MPFALTENAGCVMTAQQSLIHCELKASFTLKYTLNTHFTLNFTLFLYIPGEKLSESRAADVRELCNTLLSAYLIQLLDTGFLHADPHPGNLIRTPDGKICVLDFGLMTEVTAEQRIALVEYISHLTTQVRRAGGPWRALLDMMCWQSF
jgi:hypothetical protein